MIVPMGTAVREKEGSIPSFISLISSVVENAAEEEQVLRPMRKSGISLGSSTRRFTPASVSQSCIRAEALSTPCRSRQTLSFFVFTL